MKKVYMFPGQGSQERGMGRRLFERFARQVEEASDALGYSLAELCLEDPRRELARTEFTQPAVYVVNALAYLEKLEEAGRRPDYVAGHSLGEYDALFAAGAFDFMTGLLLVKRRGELMSRVGGGGMAAVVGLTPRSVGAVLASEGLDSVIDVANFNSYEQTVLAGPQEALAGARPLFERAGARHFVALNVSAPFHSRYLAGAEAEFERYLSGFTFSPPALAVLSNYRGRPYGAQEVRDNLARQITHPVRWIECVEHVLREDEVEFEEVGHGSVLTKLVQQILARTPFAAPAHA
ncbi:MAG TPA: ACP S-malonyltransferase [Pyrinomonadaceae bacterium]|jgi:malonyl CoA-acyl carrier protein transacylase